MISVIMPAYNAERYIGEAIESILQQTYQDFELIIVDDCSTDTTPQIIESYASQDSRIRKLYSTARNVSAARNMGIADAKGAYIAFMDADDIAFPVRLERQLTAANQQPEVVAWTAYMQEITADGEKMQPLKPGCVTLEEFAALKRSPSLVRFYACVAFIRREVLERVGDFDLRFPVVSDTDLADRLSQQGPILTVPEILLYYRQHDASISMRKVHLSNMVYGYFKARKAARMANHELTYEDYSRAYDERSLLAKFGTAMRCISLTYGRKYKIALARKQYGKALLFIFLMLVTHPVRFLSRFWRHFFEDGKHGSWSP